MRIDRLLYSYYLIRVKSPRGFFIYQKLAMTSPFTYLKHVREEFAHIVWPSNRTALAHTLVVIFIAMFIAVLVGLLDAAFGSAVNSIIGV